MRASGCLISESFCSPHGAKRKYVMYGRPHLGKGFQRFGKRIRCGHVSGLYARCMDRWP